MKSQIKNIIPVIALFVTVLVSCEDMFVTDIEVDTAEFPPRLCVSATLDTDSGRFIMSLYEGRSLASIGQGRQNEKIIRKATVNLYRDNEPIWTFTGNIDLSRYKDNTYDFPGAAPGEDHVDYIRVTGLPVAAGSVYRLEVDAEGYEKAASAAAMPSDPTVDDVSMDFDNPVHLNNTYQVNGDNWSSIYYPMKCTLNDRPGGRDYYALQAHQTSRSNNADYPPQSNAEGAGLGVTNIALIQDNPDYEEDGMELGESYDAYLFSTLLISDITFPDGNTRIDGFVGGVENRWNTYPERLPDYDSETHGVEVVYENTISLTVKHVTAETFKHYRSMVLQSGGMGFFTEPVPVVSNIENGYGCFSLQNTRRFVLKEYKLYHYPDRYPEYITEKF